MKYNLNLTKNYCAHWGLREALRELIANTIDEDGQIEYDDYEDEDNPDCGSLVLTTYSNLPIDAFLMGYSVKNAGAIGQYGEGLKLAMLVLTREGLNFNFVSGNKTYTFEFIKPEGFEQETLHLIVDERATMSQGTLICIDDVSRITYELVYLHADIGLLENSIGLYCKGLLVEPGFKVKYNSVSYGLNIPYSIESNRDRNYFSDRRLIGEALEQLTDPVEYVNFWSTASETDIMKGFSDEFKQAIAREVVLKYMPHITERDLVGKRIILLDMWTKNNEYISTDDKYFVGPYYTHVDAINTEMDWTMLHKFAVETPNVELDPDDELDEDEIESFTEKRLRLINNHIEKPNITAEDTIALLLSLIPIKRSAKEDIATVLEARGFKLDMKMVLYNLYKED